MIEFFWGQRFPNEYGLSCDSIRLLVNTVTGNVVLSDQKACAQCRNNRPEREGCNEENIKFDFGDNLVKIVDFEDYISQFDNTVAMIKDRCDYLIVDDNFHVKVAFCDLTCSEEKYVIPNEGKYKLGKRAKAVKQMTKSLECLLQIPLVDHYVLTFPEKICLFGWREYSKPNILPERKNVDNNMLAFMQTPSSVSSTLNEEVSVLEHNFRFVQVKYPSAYIW